MRAFILAGGLGSRLRPLVNHVPKVMAPLRGRPFLEYQLLWLKKNGIREVVLCTGYLGEVIEACFGRGESFGLKLYYSKEKIPLGTAGALKNAAAYVDGTFLVLNGDTLIAIELSSFLSFHRQKTGLATLALTLTEQPGSCGQVVVDQEARIVAFLEKSHTSLSGQLVNAGLYLMEPKILVHIPAQQCSSLELEIFPRLARRLELFAFSVDTSFIDIGTPENYLRAQNEIGRFCERTLRNLLPQEVNTERSYEKNGSIFGSGRNSN